MAVIGGVFDNLHLQAAVLDAVAASHAPPHLLAQRQQQRLLRLLEAAHDGSALYRERLQGRRQRSSDLARVQPVTRTELCQRFSEWVTDPALRLDELREFTADVSRVGEPWLDRYVVWESSGTSGQPGIFVQDARAMAVYDALESSRHRAPGRGAGSLFGAFGGLEVLGVADRTALVTATGGHFASVVSFERLRRLNPWLAASARCVSLMQPTADVVAQLNEFQPSILATYPTAAVLLAEEAQTGRLRIKPRCVMTGGETLSSAMRMRIGQAFGAGLVRNSYGASEFLPLAWECAHGHLHVNEDWVVLEPVDEQHRPVPLGQPAPSVLLTNLANLVQPLIRYDLGDQVTLHGKRCACGSAMPVIEVRGRCDDVLHVPALKKGRSVGLLPLALCTVIEEQAGVFDFQLLQRGPHTLVVRLPQQGEEAEQAIARCREALQAFAQQQGAEPIRVLGEPGCLVPRGRSGKACRVALDGAG